MLIFNIINVHTNFNYLKNPVFGAEILLNQILVNGWRKKVVFLENLFLSEGKYLGDALFLIKPH